MKVVWSNQNVDEILPLNREASIPLHIQLREILINEIKGGGYKPNQRLPSERELCELFGVSRMTVRKTIADLIHAGLVYTRTGKGTYVAEHKVDQQLQSLTGWSEDVSTRGQKPSSLVLKAEIVNATPDLIDKLRIPIGEEVVILSRVRMADSSPAAIETTHLTHLLCPGILKHDFSNESLYSVLRTDYEINLIKAEQTIEAALATSSELDLLHMTYPAAIFKLERRTFTEQNKIVEYVSSVYRADRYRFRSYLQANQVIMERRLDDTKTSLAQSFNLDAESV